MRQQTIALLLAASTAACAPPQLQANAPQTQARAESMGSADFLFDEASALTAAGKHAEACPKYEESDRLEHNMVTLYRLADCYESVGRIASAWEAFTKVAGEAKRAGKPEHERDARESAERLKPRLPKLTIAVSAALAGTPALEIRRDDVIIDAQLWNRPVPVDPGEHVIVAWAPSKSQRDVRVTIKEAEAKTVPLPDLNGAPWPKPGIGTWVTGGIGIAGLVVMGISGVLAKVQWDETLRTCGVDRKDECKGTSPKRPAAEAPYQSALTSASISTGGLVVGVVGAAGAVVAYFLQATSSRSAAPARAGWEITPAIGPTGTGLFVRRRF